MGFPAASAFPVTVWDGGSYKRSAALDGEPIPQIFRSPDGYDWAQACAEIIACQTAVKGNGLGNTAALGLAATSGFAYVPTCAGTPTGVPTAKTGYAAMVYDTTAHKLWIYDAGWKTGGAIS